MSVKANFPNGSEPTVELKIRCLNSICEIDFAIGHRVTPSDSGISAGITDSQLPDNTNTGGEGGIRTPDTLSGMPVFKTGAINHSATSPAGKSASATRDSVASG
jgi:hypothetical protein